MTDIDFNKLSELVIKYQNGDSGAFEQIYNMTCRIAKFTALKILNNNEADADDVVQDCFIKVMEKISTLKDPSSFMSWFNQIVANRAKSVIRKNNPHFYEKNKEEDYSEFDEEWVKEFGDYTQSDSSDNYDDSYSDESYDTDESGKREFVDGVLSEDYESLLPESDIEKEELRKTVMDMVDSLGEEKKTAVVLFYYNNMTTREISESVGVSENTIKSRLFQAKKDISKAVSIYESKNGKLLGVSPVSLVAWALRSSAVSTTITPFAASGLAVAGTAGAVAAGSAAAGGGIAAKIIAGVVVAGIVAGGSVAGTRAIKNHRAEEQTTAVVEEHVEKTTQNESVIPSRPIEEYTVAKNKLTDTYFDKGTLKYGVDYSIQRYATRNADGVEVYASRPVLNRKNFHATYEELLAGANENRQTYGTYIDNAVSEINNKRNSDGKEAFVIDDKLTEQANVRAEEIAWTDLDSDIRRNGGTNQSYTTLFDYNGYGTGSREEIRKVNFSSYESAIESILNNEEISGDFEKIGIGVAKNPENDKLVFVVHLYSSEDGNTDENISSSDKKTAERRERLDNRIDFRSRIVESAERINEKGLQIPVIKDLLSIDLFSDEIDKIEMYIIDYLLDLSTKILEELQ